MKKTKKPVSRKIFAEKKYKDIKTAKNSPEIKTIKNEKAEETLPENNAEFLFVQENFEQKKNNEIKTVAATEPKKNKIIKIGLATLFIAAILIGLGLIFYYFNGKKEKETNANPQPQPESIQTIVGRLIELPSEEVKIATVTNKEKLRSHQFFERAENGDKALIYMESKKAILYRPSINRIIEVMYISMDKNENNETIQPQEENQQQNESQQQDQPMAQNQEQASDAGTIAQVGPIKVAIYNGTNKKGLAASFAEKLSSVENVTVMQKTNAKGNYENTSIIDLKGNMSETIQKVKEIVGGEIGELPTGEIKPDADILIIAGNQ